MNNLSHPKITQEKLNLYWSYKQNGINSYYFERYFHYLKETTTTTEAFNRTNDEFFDLFGEQKYASYRSFRISLKNHLKH